MKKILIVIAVVFAVTATHAQEFYLKAGLGYGFAQAGQSIDGSGAAYNGSITNNTNGTLGYSIKSASLGTGLHGILGCGYMFNKYVGMELDAAVGIANKRYTFTDNNFDAGGGDTGVLKYTTQTLTTLVLMPAIVLQNGGDKWNVYARFGLALPVYSQSTQHQVFINYPGTGAIETDDYEWRMKYNFALGFTGAAGVAYKLGGGSSSIFVEANVLSMSLYLKEADLKSITVDGQDYPLSQLPAGFVEKIKYSKNTTVDPAVQSTQPTYAIPFSNAGITAGIRFTLSEHQGSKHHDALRHHADRF